MSVIGEYLRVTAAELDRAIRDTDWALDFAEEVQDAEEETDPAPAKARHFSTYKTGTCPASCWRAQSSP
ncbi:DUF1877 family protein [Streptomyces dubilierae]|uniref:DUF1877 family protein n=1 Tax=Streptomyces dubilierae TaxID=3075533 RepID=UPI00374DFE50